MASKDKSINNFRVGDIVEVCLSPEQEKKEWVRFWPIPIRDNEDIAQAKELVATRGGCLGPYSATFAWDARYEFRTVTP